MEEKRVCENCFGNDFIKKFIREKNQCDFKCSYCNSVGQKTIKITDLVNLIEKSLKKKYDIITPPTIGLLAMAILKPEAKPYFLISEILNLELKSKREQITTDLLQNINTRALKIKPLGLLESFKYHIFTENIKHKRRFFLKDTDLTFLDNIVSIIKKKALYTLRENSSLYRARKGLFYDKKDLFPPSNSFANIPNRMTPEGISAIYCANDIDTCALEIFNGELTSEVSVAKIRNIKDMQLIDLSIFQQFPNMFDENFEELRFMFVFVKEISRPINTSETGYEYPITQIITEYIKIKFPKAQGIIYPSSRSKDGKNYVLFMDEKHCTDDSNNINTNKYLLFENLTNFSINYSIAMNKKERKKETK